MRICIVRNAELEITASLIRIIDAVQNSNHEPLVLSRKREAEQIGIVKKEYTINQSKIKNYEINIKAKRGAGISNIVQLITYQAFVFYWLIKNRKIYDSMHVFDFDSGMPSIIVSKLFKKKMVYHIADFYVESRNVPQKMKTLIKNMEFFVINNSDEVIICNEERIEQIRGSNPKSINVIHNSPVIKMDKISKNNICKYENKDILTLAYVGTLSENRCILMMLDIIRDIPEIKIKLAGVGPIEDKVREYAKKYNNIEYIGKVNYEDAMRLYYSSDIMFAIYNPDVENNRYSAPNKIYEAMILGKAIIVGKETGMEDIIEDNNMGFTVEYDYNSIKDTLDYILDNKHIIDIKGKNARNAYEKYSWETMKERLSRLYNSLNS